MYYFLVRKFQEHDSLSAAAAGHEAMTLWDRIQQSLRIRAVEPDAARLIRAEQDRGFVTLGLTARTPDIAATTLRQLRGIGVDLARRTVPARESTWHAAAPVLFRQGVLFVGEDNDKGRVLMDFLRRTGTRPARIVFVDDKRKHVVNVDRAARAAGWPWPSATARRRGRSPSSTRIRRTCGFIWEKPRDAGRRSQPGRDCRRKSRRIGGNHGASRRGLFVRRFIQSRFPLVHIPLYMALIGRYISAGGISLFHESLREALGDQAVLDGHPVGIARDGQALVGAPSDGTAVNDHVLRVPDANRILVASFRGLITRTASQMADDDVVRVADLKRMAFQTDAVAGSALDEYERLIS